MAYCTASDAKDKTLVSLMSDNSWIDSDLNSRIEEADAVIDGKMASAGYSVPFSTVPTLIKRLSVLYTRYAVIRDAYKNKAPSLAGADSWNPYLDQFNKLIDSIVNGEILLTTTSGEVDKSDNSVLVANENIKRVMTMDDYENLSVDSSYYDPSAIGDPE